MKKTQVKYRHRKIVFVKVESSVIEISEIVHRSRRCYAISFISVWDPNRTTSCQHTLSKNASAAHWRGTVVLESKLVI